MVLKRRVALDGVQLDEVDGRILIQGIEPGAGKDQISAVAVAGAWGSRVTGEHRDSLDIAVRFSINEKSYNPDAREEVFEKVMAWAAGGGWLSVNYKPGRRIRVFPCQIPAEGDILDRGNQYSISFRACGVPWWQEENPERLQIQNVSSADFEMGAGGSTDTVMEFSFQNTSGSTVNTFSISCGEDEFQFTSLGLANRETLVYDHDDNGRRSLLRLRILGTNGTYRSAMEKRTGSDELTAKPGLNHVTMTAGGAGTLILSCAGRFA